MEVFTKCASSPGKVQLEPCMELHNALQQRDDALVTRWWSLKLKLSTLLALMEFHLDRDNAL